MDGYKEHNTVIISKSNTVVANKARDKNS
uniref:Uncharacterized protein n=1 Tax=Anguilla anguilla TaxID=7936 RepID=A0A0E9V5K9_ANGAN